MVRGLYGTEDYCDKHKDHEMFVLLASNINSISIPLSYVNSNKYYKIVNNGVELEDVEAINFNYKGNIFKPYSVCHIRGNRNTENDLIIKWTRRTRIGGAWRDNVDILLSEDFEKYNIEVLDVNNNDRLKRIIEVSNSQTATYTAENQISDFGSVQTSVRISVCQLSAVVGAGYKKEVFI